MKMRSSLYELSSSIKPHPPQHEQEHQVDLTEDVLFEIFLRLPLKSIYKFKCVSKSCLSLLSDPSFVNKYVMKSCDGSIPWSLVNRHHFNFMDYSFDDSIHKPTFFVTMSTQLHHELIFSQPGFSFEFLDSYMPKQEIRGVFPLASSYGLLLYSSKEYGSRDYFICNPFTRQFVSLPRPTPNIETKGINGFFYQSSTRTYKLIHIEDSCICRSFNLQSFSSDTGEWSTHQVTCSHEMHINNYLDPRSCYNRIRATSHLHIVNYHSGTWYWIDGRGYRMIAYCQNGGGGQCRLFDLPEGSNRVKFEQQCLGESKGLLYYDQIEKVGEASTVSVWVFQNGCYSNGSTRNLVCKDTKIEDHIYVIPTQRTKKEYSFIAFNPVDPNVVIMDCHHEHHYHACEMTYNIKTRQYEILRSSPTLLDCYYYIPDTRIAVALQQTIIPTVTS